MANETEALKFTDDHWARVVSSMEGKALEAEAAMHDSIKFLSASRRSVRALKDRSWSRQFLGKLTGGNNRLRDASIANLQRSHDNTLALLLLLSEQNVCLMDAVALNQKALTYLNIELLEHQEFVNRVFDNMNKRLHGIERRFNEYVQTGVWGSDAHAFAESRGLKEGSFALCAAMVQDYFDMLTATLPATRTHELQQNVYQWPNYIRTQFQDGMRNAGYRDRHKLSLRALVEELATYYRELHVDGTYHEHLSSGINRYPVPLLPGQNLSAIVNWEVDATVTSEPVEKIVEKIQDLHGIGLDYKLSWIDIGFEMLYTKKQLHNRAFVADSMAGLIDDVLFQLWRASPGSDKPAWLHSDRVTRHDANWASMVAGYRIHLVRGGHEINVIVQYFEEKSQKGKVRVVLEFIGYDACKGRIVGYYVKAQLADFNYEDVSCGRFEVVIYFEPDWNSWEQQRESIAATIARHVDMLERGEIPGVFERQGEQ